MSLVRVPPDVRRSLEPPSELASKLLEVVVVRGLLSDEEWAFFSPFVIEQGPKRGRSPTDHRRVLDAVSWIARTGSPWRDLPGELGLWSSVYKQFLR